MKLSILVLSMALAVAFVLTAGCTQNTTPPVVTPTPSAAPVATTVASHTTALPGVTIPKAGMGTPGPTQTLPPNYMLDFMVQGNGDTVNPYMAVTLRGGNGMNFDSRVDVTFTKPDGTSQQDFMLPPFHVVVPASKVWMSPEPVPGARMPLTASVPLMSPVPPKVPLASTETALPAAVLPSMISLPPLTVVAPV